MRPQDQREALEETRARISSEDLQQAQFAMIRDAASGMSMRRAVHDAETCQKKVLKRRRMVDICCYSGSQLHVSTSVATTTCRNVLGIGAQRHTHTHTER